MILILYVQVLIYLISLKGLEVKTNTKILVEILFY